MSCSTSNRFSPVVEDNLEEGTRVVLAVDSSEGAPLFYKSTDLKVIFFFLFLFMGSPFYEVNIYRCKGKCKRRDFKGSVRDGPTASPVLDSKLKRP